MLGLHVSTTNLPAQPDLCPKNCMGVPLCLMSAEESPPQRQAH